MRPRPTLLPDRTRLFRFGRALRSDCQGGVRLLTEAQPDDGVFDIAVLTPGSLRQWMALAWAVIRRRRHVPLTPATDGFRGARVEVRSNRPRRRKLDGDLIDPGHRLLVEMVPKALWLCVAQPAGHPDLAEDADAAAQRAVRLSGRGHVPATA